MNQSCLVNVGTYHWYVCIYTDSEQMRKIDMPVPIEQREQIHSAEYLVRGIVDTTGTTIADVSGEVALC